MKTKMRLKYKEKSTEYFEPLIRFYKEINLK
jgi:hypothetical protein